MLVAHVCMLLKFITTKFGNITIIVTIMQFGVLGVIVVVSEQCSSTIISLIWIYFTLITLM
jgi:hypothetical protein